MKHEDEAANNNKKLLINATKSDVLKRRKTGVLSKIHRTGQPRKTAADDRSMRLV